MYSGTPLPSSEEKSEQEKIDVCRDAISEIDADICSALVRRVAFANEIAHLKQELSVNLESPVQEAVVTERARDRVGNDAPQVRGIKPLFKAILDFSKLNQKINLESAEYED